MSEQLTPERAVRLLKAKSADLENQVRQEATQYQEPGVVLRPVTALAADIAIIAILLAEHIERTECGGHEETQDALEELIQPFREGFDEGRPE